MTPDRPVPPGPEEASAAIPPRPNLGPEPWPEEIPGWIVLATGWGSGLVFLLILATLRRRRKQRLAARASEIQGPTEDPGAVDESPGRRLIAASEAVRAALIAAFGPAWGSKTTEEIAADPALAGRVDPEEVDRLVAFLKVADLAKFAGVEPDPIEGRDAWAGQFAAGLAAGATSRMTGK